MNTILTLLHRFVVRAAVPTLAALLLFVVAACGDRPDAVEEPAADTTAAMVQPAQDQNIVDVAQANGDFSTFVSALQQTGLAETLSGPGPFTVFAPTDAAFAALQQGTLDALSDEELTNILTYHVANGRMSAADVGGMKMIPTAQGSDLAVTVGADGSVKVNDATITTTDIEAANGVIHVIDAVLMPPSDAM